MRICPRCRSEFDDHSLDVCPFDNWGLVTPEDYYDAEGDVLLGALLGGRFRIVGRLGVGAMGTVYRAIQSSVDRPVALKVLRPDLTKDPDTAARFHREAHATSALKHPNTVTLYDFGQTAEGYLYIAMELLEGRLLGKMLKEEGALPIDMSVRIAVQIARSLAEAHRKGIVHRDLKPDNIVLAQLEGQEVVKVLDFGIAKVIRGDKRLDVLETQAGTVFGTPRYMSPEQAQSTPLDARSDLYSLGVILYQMLTGHAPFEDSDAVVVMARHIKTKPRRPSDVRPDLKLPAKLEKLVLRLMEKDRNKRPQSAEELIDTLTGLSASTEDDFSVLSEGGAGRGRERRTVPIIAAAAVAVVLAAGGVIAFALTNREDEQALTPATLSDATEIDEPSERSPNDEQTMVFDASADETIQVEVILDSEPSGAIVLRDGREVGETPLTLTETNGAEVSFNLSLEGYETSTEVVSFDDGEESSRLVRLTPQRTKSRGANARSQARRSPPTKEPEPSPPQESPEPSLRYGRFDDR